MLKKASGLVAIAALSCSLPAHAAQYMFNFATSTPLFGGSVNGSGVFTTSDTPMMVGGQTAYVITSITGQVNGFDIVAPTGSYGNYFTTGPSFLDGTGVTFKTTGSSNHNTVTFFNQSSNGIYRVNTFSPGSSSFVTASSSAVAAVPEPVSWALFIIGFALVGTALRTRRPHLAPLAA
ncbi:hypothetical protein M2337_001207 [Sphingobium sp. B2D3A]|uniref:PEPxxWA-CTERM sorting domain-containing protein n=1 Tax=unclassified Sphingobium TaxID=2611147 RepID=UPI0022258E05|nr:MULTISPECIES: PEPxxWA-CTERM sorting domain-containing protein [unclassified Sphingobium]MCW2336974.1 hypothetical protein [Sphingobium sp. B2D3A]MCW2386727.1 hypothetical protein [Sphingobium sp. B2D3D]MCW2413472.1 hypothetical protein [Sphingobium sp. B8D3D]MCW2414229.1 hypothetical protein [Sphingobium sp. B8D3A]